MATAVAWLAFGMIIGGVFGMISDIIPYGMFGIEVFEIIPVIAIPVVLVPAIVETLTMQRSLALVAVDTRPPIHPREKRLERRLMWRLIKRLVGRLVR